MYIRFVVAEINEDSGQELGVIHAASNLQAAGMLYSYEEEHYKSVRQWFNEHLARPTRFAAAKKPFNNKQNKAISWFKDSARHHLAKARELSAILQNHGIMVTMRTASHVGYVVYEDAYQIVAEPFVDDE
jgi:hypothetical protein